MYTAIEVEINMILEYFLQYYSIKCLKLYLPNKYSYKLFNFYVYDCLTLIDEKFRQAISDNETWNIQLIIFYYG